MNIVIIKLIFAAFIGFITFALINAYYYRIKGTLKKTSGWDFNKQQYVKQNRVVFGIVDKECSDIKEVYTVSPERMGF